MKKTSEIKNTKKRTLTPLDQGIDKTVHPDKLFNDAALREAREAVMHDQFKSYQKPDSK